MPKIIAIDPTNGKALFRCAMAYRKMGKLQNAKKYLIMAVKDKNLNEANVQNLVREWRYLEWEYSKKNQHIVQCKVCRAPWNPNENNVDAQGPFIGSKKCVNCHNLIEL